MKAAPEKKSPPRSTAHQSQQGMASAAVRGPTVTLRAGTAAMAAMGASLVGLGLARFAFAPVQPALVAAGWFSKGAAAFLAAANLLGYLGGALYAVKAARHISAPALLRGMMLLVSLSFLTCASPSLPFAWFFFWRIISGIAGGMIIVLAAPTVLACVERHQRGALSQISFFGLSLGIVCAGSLVPLLLHHGLSTVWIGLGLLSLATTALTWRLWPPAPIQQAIQPHKAPRGTLLFCIQYALVALGVVPHMVFLFDYLERSLKLGVTVGAHFYLIYAAGALIGPFVLGHLSDRMGIRRTLRCAIPIQFAAVALLLTGTSLIALTASCFLAGLCMPGIISTFLARSQEIANGDPLLHKSVWSKATMFFALAQAVEAYGAAHLIHRTDSAYVLVFIFAAAAMAIAFAIDFVPQKSTPNS